eukprot:TRINITY_DN25131_c0_g4_i1.p1 TRINITY_DN25131_c0_g4~~TRINITY_DN25131_c0_g4_i1.p1  ORF type:complete len:794 (-),score=55.89 TRINITY_DN25131_c0_g4_i1:351-2381(-)
MVSVAVLAVPLMCILRLSRSTSYLRGMDVETLLSVFGCLVSVLLVAQHPWFVAKALSINDPYMFLLTDDKLLLHLDVWLTGLHLMLPMRWTFLMLISFVCFVAYSLPLVVLGSQQGSHSSAALNAIALLMLTVAATWAKRSLELLERTAFTQIAQERTLRYEVEHQLSSLAPAKVRPRDPDASSVGTSLVFDLGTTERIDEQLQDIVACGLKEHWLIEPERIRPVDDGFISSGGFGMVMLAYYHGAEVAVKIPRVSRDARTLNTLKAIAAELRIFRRLRHPHIVAFHGACIDLTSINVVIVLEYVRGTLLRTASSCVPVTPDAFSERLLWADNICSALVYLHAQDPSIVHSDIKDTNVLIEHGSVRRIAKLLDFGLSRLLKGQDVAMGGTLSWMAPEVILQGKNSASTKADVFSFGRLLYKIMTGQAPLQGVGAAVITAQAQCGPLPPLQWPSSTPLLPACSSLCDECLRWKPVARPAMICVQASLREWSWRADVPEHFGASIREVLPHRPSSESLRAVLEGLRGEGADSNFVAPCLDPQKDGGGSCHQQLQDSPSKSRNHRVSIETSSRAQQLTIATTLLKWNIPIEDSCCVGHAKLRALGQTVLLMQKKQECLHLPSIYGWQCQTCGLLGNGECELCSGAVEHSESCCLDPSQMIENKSTFGADVQDQVGPMSL